MPRKIEETKEIKKENIEKPVQKLTQLQKKQKKSRP